MSQNPGFRMLYEARQKTLIDKASKYKYSEKKGIEKGRKEGKDEGLQEGMEKGKEVGIQERKIQLIRGMHKNGMDIEDIAKFTNMELSDIRHILGQ
ncbi:hypothetical protein COI59_31430 [Bacillus toyonensis]|nr:hypothetical protein COI59_31430 [Bacillus toyonensis]